jgi:AraC-like DNA-binding protein
MDALAAVLDGPRAHGAFVLRIAMDPPWRIEVFDDAPLALMAVMAGTTWTGNNTTEPIQLFPGDVIMAKGPGAYWLADDPHSPPQIEIYEGNRCVTVDGRPVHDDLAQGVRTWGTNPDGRDQLVLGTYLLDSDISDRLVAGLPPLAIVRRKQWDPALLGILDGEATRQEPGQTAVLDRLVDVVLISALRAWFSHQDDQAPGWFRAHADPSVGMALRLLHHNPATSWTVASLAEEVGVSRATLARRFTELVGEAPMTYLQKWRVSLAADRLREPGATVTSVAPDVGYQSPYALSTAFKRVLGVSPREHQRAHANPVDAP